MLYMHIQSRFIRQPISRIQIKRALPHKSTHISLKTKQIQVVMHLGQHVRRLSMQAHELGNGQDVKGLTAALFQRVVHQYGI